MLPRNDAGHAADRVADLLVAASIHDGALEDVHRGRNVDGTKRKTARARRLAGEPEVADRAADDGDPFLERQRERQPHLDRPRRVGGDFDSCAHGLEAFPSRDKRVGAWRDARDDERARGVGDGLQRRAFDLYAGVGHGLPGFVGDDASSQGRRGGLGGRGGYD